MPIVELGHAGIWVTDVGLMTDFYERVLGLTVTDRDDELGMVFLSSRPEIEHHELVIAAGREVPMGTQAVHQISWRVDSLETLLDFHQRFRDEGVLVQQEVTHGNAYGIYFFDPEGNRNEVYLRVERDIPQPFRKSLNLDLPPDQILEEAEHLLVDGTKNYQPAP